jgi:DNA repair photolyase
MLKGDIMKNSIVVVEEMKSLIKKAPGFVKKELADYKLDIIALCGFGCKYCSSNTGNYLRINQKKFAKAVENQIGKSVKPKEDPALMMIWPDVVDQLANELESKPKDYGEGKVLMFSMLTDGFSPYLVKEGITEGILEMLVEKTSFKIRVLTKNAVVGNPEWVEFFKKHADRFIVGLSTGSLDDKWIKNIEIGTSIPKSRFKAYANLQKAGVSTFGMLCPVFPDQMNKGAVEMMLDLIHPEKVDQVWIEPFNDRANWRVVRASYPEGSSEFNWFTDVYESGMVMKWSQYASELYVRVREKAVAEGWLHKLKYLLYEGSVTESDSKKFSGLEGVLLQSKPGEDGLSRNPHIAKLQR